MLQDRQGCLPQLAYFLTGLVDSCLVALVIASLMTAFMGTAFTTSFLFVDVCLAAIRSCLYVEVKLRLDYPIPGSRVDSERAEVD